MARNRFVLSCALRHVFLHDFGLDRVFVMNDLAALYIYYADEHVLPQLAADFNKLNVWLTKVELIRKPHGDENYPIPKDFKCDLDTDDSQIQLFKFSPVINMPPKPNDAIDPDVLDELARELSCIDVAALASYVRSKAIAAGDLTLNDIEGDTNW